MLSFCGHVNELMESVTLGNILSSWVTTRSYILAPLNELFIRSMSYVANKYSIIHFTIHNIHQGTVLDKGFASDHSSVATVSKCRWGQEAKQMHCCILANRCWNAITGQYNQRMFYTQQLHIRSSDLKISWQFPSLEMTARYLQM